MKLDLVFDLDLERYFTGTLRLNLYTTNIYHKMTSNQPILMTLNSSRILPRDGINPHTPSLAIYNYFNISTN